MPRPKPISAEVDKEAVLGGFLRIPRSLAHACRLPGCTPRYQLYQYAGRYYLVFRVGERPSLREHEFRPVHKAHGVPWMIYQVERLPRHKYETEGMRRAAVLERVRTGTAIQNLPDGDATAGFEECYRLLELAEKRLRELDEVPRRERQLLADAYTDLQAERAKVSNLREQLSKESSQREQDLTRTLEQTRDNLQESLDERQRLQNQLDELQDELRNQVRNNVEARRAHANEVQEMRDKIPTESDTIHQLRQERKDVTEAYEQLREKHLRVAEQYRVLRLQVGKGAPDEDTPADPATVPDDQWD